MDPLMVCAKPGKPVSSKPTSIIVVLRIFWRLLINMDLGGVLSACRRTTSGEEIQRRSAPATGQNIKTNLHTRKDHHRGRPIPALSNYFVKMRSGTLSVGPKRGSPKPTCTAMFRPKRGYAGKEGDLISARRELPDYANGPLRRIGGEDAVMRRELRFEIAFHLTQDRKVVIDGEDVRFFHSPRLFQATVS